MSFTKAFTLSIEFKEISVGQRIWGGILSFLRTARGDGGGEYRLGTALYFARPCSKNRTKLCFLHRADMDRSGASAIFMIRLPRVLSAMMIGAALALSGAAYQSVFKNPLVAPDMLGVSSGACVGASLAILLGLPSISVQIGAFIGGILAVICAVSIPKIIGKNSIIMLVLSGIIVGGLMSSVLGIIKYLADSETQLPEITYWQLGSLVNVIWGNILYSGIPILLCVIFMFLVRWKMNILTLGDVEIHMLGNRSAWLRYGIILTATVLTACSVCRSGTIGWIGLVIPHFARMLVGADNQKLIPLSAVLGAVFLLFIDTVSRASMSAEIPLSILTGLIGAPFYFYLLVKERLALR